MCDFLEDATNIYRTKNYIVKQCIDIQTHYELNNVIASQDTFYRRTKARDKTYEKCFIDKQNINGKRLKTSMSSRTYVD